MIKLSHLTPLVLAAALLSCNAGPYTLAELPATGVPAAMLTECGTLLEAHVSYPTAARRLQSVPDPTSAATISLIDLGTHRTVVAGVTGSDSRVTLQPPVSFNPAVGTVYLLESIKGLNDNAAGADALRLRTFVKWTADGWTSITGSTVVINALTTAVALTSDMSPGDVPPADTMNKVDAGVSPAALRATPAFANQPDSQLAAFGVTIADYVAGAIDPVASVVRAAPTLGALSQDTGAAGGTLILTGTGFSALPAANTVTIGGESATILMASPTTLLVTVPAIAAGATTVAVTTTNGTTATLPFTVASGPVITGTSPASVYAGDTLTLTGTNFDPVAANNRVVFGDTALVPSAGTATSLQVVVPANASERVSVQVFGATSNTVTLASGQSLTETFTTDTYRDATSTAIWSPLSPSRGTMRQVITNVGDGSDGALNPTSDVVLSGTKQYTSINIPAGVRVVAGSYVTPSNLTILVQGDVTIAGMIDADAQTAYQGNPGGNVTIRAGGLVNLTGSIMAGGDAGVIGSMNSYYQFRTCSSSYTCGLGTCYSSYECGFQPPLQGYYGTDGGRGGNVTLFGSLLNFGASKRIETQGGARGETRYSYSYSNNSQSNSVQYHNAGATGGVSVQGEVVGSPNGASATATLAPKTYDTTGSQTLQSKAYDLGTSAHATVHYDAFALSATTPTGTSATTEFSDSADGLTWSAWTPTVTTLSRRYFRFKTTLATTDAALAPAVSAAKLKYHF